MENNFEKEILEMDESIRNYRERLDTDEEFRKKMENVKKDMFGETDEG